MEVFGQSSSNSQGVHVPKLRFPGFEGEWESSLLGELGTFTKGAPLSKADISENGTPFILYGELYTTYKEVTNHIVRKTNKEVDSSQYSRVGDVIIPTSGETPEEIATATCVMLPDVILAGDLNIFRSEMVDGRIISYIINHIVNRDISRIAQGKSVVHIKADELSKISISYPDVDEQNKLITFLTVLSDRIEKQRQLVEALKSYKRGALSKLFPQKGETVPKYRFAGFTEPWEQRKLGEIGTTYTGLSGKSKSDFGHGKGKFITYMNVFSNPIALPEGVEPIEIDDRQNEVQTGDVFFTTSSETPEEVGMSSVLLENRGKTYLNSFCFGYRPTEKIDSHYLAYMLRSYNVRQKIIFLAQGISRYNISKNKMMDIAVPIPSYGEQQQIGTYFEHLDNLITLHQRELNVFQAFKTGLLQHLFI